MLLSASSLGKSAARPFIRKGRSADSILFYET